MEGPIRPTTCRERSTRQLSLFLGLPRPNDPWIVRGAQQMLVYCKPCKVAAPGSLKHLLPGACCTDPTLGQPAP